jgi:hypothetical protein
LCLEGNAETNDVFLRYCNETSKAQQWVFGFARVTKLKHWVKEGVPIMDSIEIHDLSHDNHHMVEQCKGSEEVKK